jgi:hypothetical protein
MSKNSTKEKFSFFAGNKKDDFLRKKAKNTQFD